MRFLPPWRRTARWEGEPLAPDLADGLDAFARAALRPDDRVLARTRSAVLARFVDARLGAAPARPLRRRWTLAATGALAGLLAFSAAAAASGPGQPLYGLRLAVEELTLPAHVPDRAAAQLDHLERRLAEARDASDRGNERGVLEALVAYQGQLEAAVRPNGRAPGLEIALERHRTMLEALAPIAPAAARATLTEALDQLEGAIDAASQVPGLPAESGPPDSPGPPDDVPGGRP